MDMPQACVAMPRASANPETRRHSKNPDFFVCRLPLFIINFNNALIVKTFRDTIAPLARANRRRQMTQVPKLPLNAPGLRPRF